MSEIDAAADLVPPPGTRMYGSPGWDFLPTDGERRWPPALELVRTSAGFNLPERFRLEVREVPSEDMIAVLYFRIDDGQLRLPLVGGGAADADQAIVRLRSYRADMSFWRSAAVRFAQVSTFIEEQRREHGQHLDTDEISNDAVRAFATTLTRSRDFTNPRRERITPALLSEVAAVYRTAFDAGSNPTQAVADHFRRPRSTASRWVVEARKSGALGAADGSRPGEVTGGPWILIPAPDQEPPDV